MKKILLLLVPIFIISCSTDRKKLSSLHEYKLTSDIEGVKLYGNIKSIRNNLYNANEESGQIKKGDMVFSPNSSDYIYSRNIYCIYDTNQNRIEVGESMLNSHNKEELLISKFEYDSEGRQISMTTRNRNDKLTSDKNYKYDENGNILELKDRRGYYYTFKYDDNGNRIEKKYFIEGMGLQETEEYKFDDKGNKVESIYSSSDSNYIGKKYYKYDGNGNLIEWGYDKPLYTYEYDRKGNIVKIKNEFGEVYKFKYEFDNEENWIKRVEYINEIPTYIVERTIEYFADSSAKETIKNDKKEEFDISEEFDITKHLRENEFSLNGNGSVSFNVFSNGNGSIMINGNGNRLEGTITITSNSSFRISDLFVTGGNYDASNNRGSNGTFIVNSNGDLSGTLRDRNGNSSSVTFNKM